MKLTVLALLLGSTLTACSLETKPVEQPIIEKPVTLFNYIIEGGNEWGVSQAFTVGNNAYVQFLDVERVDPVFISTKGEQLPFKVNGMYAILDDAPARFFVVSSFGRAHVINKTLHEALEGYKEQPFIDKNIKEIQKSPLVEKNVNKPVEPVEITPPSTQEQLQALADQQNKQLKSVDPSAHYLAQPTTNSITVAVYFDDFSTEIKMSDSDKNVMLAAAKEAKKIRVRGFTDSFTTSEKAVELAKFRAIYTARLLKTESNTQAETRSLYRSARGFAVPNTPENKHYNRRAEVTYYF